MAFKDLKVCAKCGWHDLQYTGHRCDPGAGKTADALIQAVPEAQATKLGYGNGKVVLGHRIDDHDFVLLFDVNNGSLKWRDVTCFAYDLSVEDAADLVRTLLAWRNRVATRAQKDG